MNRHTTYHAARSFVDAFLRYHYGDKELKAGNPTGSLLPSLAKGAGERSLNEERFEGSNERKKVKFGI